MFGRYLSPYFPGTELIDAVNLAIFLKRPLLLKGEPGCGKTRLASAVAFELGLPYYEWHVKSTDRAQDGLYRYDAVRRLGDAQLARNENKNTEKINADYRNIDDYIDYGPLGKAFKSDKQCVVLIDEIDKADIDFPNDLLVELDEKKYTIKETNKTITANHPPIVFITSNDEKELPEAFLRRCLFKYIEFPDKPRLIEIVRAHFPDAKNTVIEKVSERFMLLRKEMEADSVKEQKKISTSELIDWFTIFNKYPEDEALSILVDGKLPFPSVLLKSWNSHTRYLYNKNSSEEK
jgi:MoxR-like ATPase